MQLHHILDESAPNNAHTAFFPKLIHLLMQPSFFLLQRFRHNQPSIGPLNFLQYGQKGSKSYLHKKGFLWDDDKIYLTV